MYATLNKRGDYIKGWKDRREGGTEGGFHGMYWVSFVLIIEAERGAMGK